MLTNFVIFTKKQAQKQNVKKTHKKVLKKQAHLQKTGGVLYIGYNNRNPNKSKVSPPTH